MTERRIKYPIGEQDFENLIKEGFLYVDKTRYIHELVTRNKYYFLSRPRRFGKSLLLSTIKAYFEGKKELFENLAIRKLEQEWVKHPVLHLSLAKYNPSESSSLIDILSYQLTLWEKEYDISFTDKNPAIRFSQIIKEVAEKTGKGVVVLIDEYDAPLLYEIETDCDIPRIRDTLKSFYTNFKDNAQYLRFVMLTGVTRFSKLNIFSGLNNLQDITLDNKYACICGITETELQDNFGEGLERLGEKWKLDRKETSLRLKRYYDGYHFTEECPDIYNPFSILNVMESEKIDNYWFSTGIPSFIVERFRKENVNLEKNMNRSVDAMTMKAMDTLGYSTVATLFQAGFLTIKDYDEDLEEFKLGIPNLEVQQGMSGLFMEYFLYPDRSEGQALINKLIRQIKSGDINAFLSSLQTFFAGVPFDMSKGSKEVYFHNAFYILITLIGIKTKTEYHTSTGSIDLLIETEKFLYIMEFKLDRSAEEALRQIKEKNYGDSFSSDKRKIVMAGVNFSTQKRNIDSWLIN